MKKFLSLVLALLLAFSCMVTGFAAKQPSISARSALAINLDNGEMLYAKNSTETIDPSLLSQMMTLAIVLDDYDKIKNDEVTISYAVQNKMYDKRVELGQLRLANLNAGETFTVEELFKAVAIRSACEASMALAEYVSGSEANFVAEMNIKAKELGMKNTVFHSSYGIYDENSNAKTTAEDILILAEHLLKYPEFVNVMGNTSFTAGGHSSLTTVNSLLSKSKAEYYNADATGLHFAFHDKITDTKNYGSSLVATYTGKNGSYLVIVLGSQVPNDDNASFTKAFVDANAIYSYVSTNFEYKDVIKEGQSISDVKLRLAKGNKDFLKVVAETGYRPYVAKDTDISKFTKELDVPASVDAPIEKGQQIGNLYIKDGQKVLATIKIVSAESVEVSRGMLAANRIKDVLSSPIFIVLILAVFLLIAGYIAFAVLGNKRGFIKKPKLIKKPVKNEEPTFIEKEQPVETPKKNKNSEDDEFIDI